MNNIIIPIIVTYNNSRKMIDFNPSLNFQVLKTSVRDEFELPFGELKIFSARLKAEVTIIEFIKEEEEYYIEHLIDVVQIQLPQNNFRPLQIDLQAISDKVFQEEDLLFELNQWAYKKKYKLVVSEGKKPTRDGYRQVIGC